MINKRNLKRPASLPPPALAVSRGLGQMATRIDVGRERWLLSSRHSEVLRTHSD